MYLYKFVLRGISEVLRDCCGIVAGLYAFVRICKELKNFYCLYEIVLYIWKD